MNWKKLFDGRPDGVGFGEDPRSLYRLYAEFEAACMRMDLRTGNLSAVWHPLGLHLSELDLRNRSRREMADRLLEAYRIGEAGVATIEVFEHEAVNRVLHAFESMPGRLKTAIFGMRLIGPELNDRTRIFRKTFRVAWQAANLTETVLLRRGTEDGFDSEDELDENWERVADGSAPTAIRIAESRFDFREMGYQADQEVRQPLRHAKRDNRADVLSECQSALFSRRMQLTAIMKAVHGRK